MGNPSGHSLIRYGVWAFPAEMALRLASKLRLNVLGAEDPDIHYMWFLQGVEATVFGMLMSLHIASHMTGKVLGSVLTTAFGVTSSNFTNLAPLVLVRHLWQLVYRVLTCKGGVHE